MRKEKKTVADRIKPSTLLKSADKTRYKTPYDTPDDDWLLTSGM